MSKIANIAELVLYFNNDDQQGQDLTIITPNQMLSRLPISLAELNAGNNSEKLKKRNQATIVFFVQIKKLTKQIHKSLIDII